MQNYEVTIRPIDPDGSEVVLHLDSANLDAPDWSGIVTDEIPSSPGWAPGVVAVELTDGRTATAEVIADGDIGAGSQLVGCTSFAE